MDELLPNRFGGGVLGGIWGGGVTFGGLQKDILDKIVKGSELIILLWI